MKKTFLIAVVTSLSLGLSSSLYAEEPGNGGNGNGSPASNSTATIAQQPSMLSNQSFSNLLFNINLSQHNAIAFQQSMNAITLAVTTKSVNKILGTDEDKDDKGNGGNPGGENPGGENPGGENPGGENPGGENPGGENPGGENPGGGNPGGENPGGENPGGENSGGENSKCTTTPNNC